MDETKIALGKLAVLERMVGVLIATHPEPELLHEAWSTLAPRFAQDLRKRFSLPTDKPFHDAASALMGQLTRTVQHAAAQANRKPGAPSNH